jgi:hypothetical protein
MRIKQNFLKKLAGAGLVLFPLLGSGYVNAQNDNPGPAFGVKGGLNLSTLFVNDDNINKSNWKAGYHAGLFVKVPLTTVLAVQPEVLYSSMGSKVIYGGSGLEQTLGIRPGEVRFNLNYVQVPILFVVNIGAINVHAGPYASYLLNANVKNLQSGSDFINSGTLLELSENDFQRVDYGLAAGIGFDLQNVKVGARYNYGLHEIGDGGIAGRLTGNARNSVAQVFVGFGF